MAAAIGLAVIMGMTGCAGKEGMPGNPQENVSVGAEHDTAKQENTDGVTEKEREGENGSDVPKTQEGEWEREDPVPAQEKKNEEPAESGGEAAKESEKQGQAVAMSQDTAHLGGKVQAPQADGMTLARRPGRNDMREAGVSDLEEGMGVELEGYYEGEVFVATRVIMEEYV